MAEKARFYLSTYTERLPHVKSAGPGILACSIDLESGALSIESKVTRARNPSYLWLNKDRSTLYAIGEVLEHEGQADGCIQVYHLTDDHTQAIQLAQVISSSGSGAAYCRGDQSEQFLLNVNYLAGSIHSFPIDSKGELASPCSSHQLFGSGPNKARQEGPHPHCIVTNLQNNRAYVTDLGTDRLIAYQFEASTGELTEWETEGYRFTPNSGPRHCWFHPNGEHLFVSLELSSELALLKIKNGAPTTEVSTVSTTQADQRNNHPSELLITSDGKHIYVANRGADTIAAFSLEANSHDLEYIGEYPCGGQTPRHIALSPDERFMIVANQDSNEVSSLIRDPSTGALSATEHTLPINAPCFIAFR
ncbi:MAG: lactonase family protein [Opitutaceae bacterium]